MGWQQRARYVTATFLVVFASVLYLAIRPRPTTDVPPVVQRTDPQASMETAPGLWLFESGDTIAFTRLLTYPDGRSIAREVTITLRERNGRRIVIQAREAWQQAPSTQRVGRLSVRGDVTARTSDGLVVRAAEAEYDEETDRVVIPGHAEFEQGRTRGSGDAAHYDRRNDRLSLERSVRVQVAGDDGGLDAVASAAEYARRDQTIEARGTVHVAETSREMAAENATFRLDAEASRLVAMVLSGGATVRPASAAASSALQDMSADRIEIDYGDDGRTLRAVRLVGHARLLLGGPEASKSPQEVHGRSIEIDLTSDGGSVARLAARDETRFVVPASVGRAGLAIRAASLEARGGEGGRLQTAVFRRGVEFRESSGKGSADRVVRAAAVTLTFDADGEVAAAEFGGGVTFTDAPWRADAPAARYDPSTHVLTLSGRSSPPSRPRVQRDRFSLDADRVRIILDTDQVEGEGRVQSVVRNGPANANARDREAVRLPRVLDAAEPVYVTADALRYDGRVSTAEYRGGVRMWQGANVIRGERLMLDDRRGNLDVSGNASLQLVLSGSRQTGEGRRLTGDAERVVYDEASGTLRYVGTAHVDGPAGDLRADQIEVVLAEDGDAVARVEARSSVVLGLEGGHRATADRLTYTAPTERYRLEGRPVRLQEARAGGCRETTGVVLTFTRSADTITVDGTDGQRSRTVPVACAERRL